MKTIFLLLSLSFVLCACTDVQMDPYAGGKSPAKAPVYRFD